MNALDLTVSGQAKPQLYFHLGAGKTGTTTIQNFCRQNSEALAAASIWYPELLPSVHTSNAFALTEILKKDGKTEAGREKFANLMRELHSSRPSDSTKILLSNETMAMYPAWVCELICQISSRFFDLKIIIFLRDPLAWYYSAWGQIIQTIHEARSFELFFRERGPTLYQWTNYEIWAKYATDIHVLSYEEHKNHLVSAFFQPLGWEAAKVFPGCDAGHANTGLPLEMTLLLRLFNGLFGPDPEWHRVKHSWFKSTSSLGLSGLAGLGKGAPDPSLAPAANQFHERMFAFTDAYLPRERIIAAYPPVAERSGPLSAGQAATEIFMEEIAGLIRRRESGARLAESEAQRLAESEAQRLAESEAEAQRQAEALYTNSRSWRLTKPLRFLGRLARRLKSGLSAALARRR